MVWPATDWTIDGANEGPYSARDLCPRGNHSGGSHSDGDTHGETHEVAALESNDWVCLHTVVLRRAAVTVDPPAEEPPTTETPPVAPPQSQTPALPEAAPTPPAVGVLPATATPRTLPATGNASATTLLIGSIMLGLGGCLSVLARRRNDQPLH